MAVRGDFTCPSAGRFSGRLWGVSHGRRHDGSDSCPEDAEWTMSGVETESKHNCALNSQVDRRVPRMRNRLGPAAE